MFAQERHREIKDRVRQHRRLSFQELQSLVGVSPATLRRDLAELEKSGDVIRVHGGVLHPAYMRTEVSFDERLLRHSAAKKRIAQHAAALIPAGASVFIDAGSTCLEAGRLLLTRKDVRILTHSVALLALSLHGQADVLCIGGTLRRVSGALVGGSALGALARLHADFALLGASGINPAGCTTTELTEAEIKTALLQRATRSLLLADISKWPTASTVAFADWSSLSDWITDQLPAPGEARALRRQGLTIHLAT